MEREEYEKRFTAMETKVDVITEFINGLKASVEADKKAPAKDNGILSIFD